MKQKIRTALAVSTILLPLSWVSPPVEAKLYHDPITNGNVLGNLAYLKEVLTNSLQALQEIENLHNQMDDLMKAHDPQAFQHLQNYHAKVDDFIGKQSALSQVLDIPDSDSTTRQAVSQSIKNIFRPDNFVEGLSEYQKQSYYQQTLRHDLEASEMYLGQQKNITSKILKIFQDLMAANKNTDLAQKQDMTNRILAEMLNLQQYQTMLMASHTRSRSASEYLGADAGLSADQMAQRNWQRIRERNRKFYGIDKMEQSPHYKQVRENIRLNALRNKAYIECKKRHGNGIALEGFCPVEETKAINRMR